MDSSIANSVIALGKTFTRQRTTTTDGAVLKDPILPAAKIGTLTTRTDANTGTFTMASGHGFVTSDRIDLYWSGGKRYGMTATVTGDSAVLDGGTGDDLPIATTPITAMKPQLESFPVTAANMSVLVMGCNAPAQAVLRDDGPAVVFAIYVGGTLDSYQWDSASGADNPLSADVVDVYLSHGSTSAQQVSILAAVN